MVVEVPARFVIGVDLGGTKLLAGAVDPERLTVHHRTRREAFGIDQAALLDAAVDAVQEASEAVDGDIKAVGFGIPCTFDRRTGVAVQAVNLPLADLKFGEVMSERLGLPVEVDNDANCAVWAEARAGAAQGLVRRGAADDRDGDRRRAWCSAAGCTAGGRARAPRWGTWSSTSTARRARATARTGAASRRSPRGPRSCARRRCGWRASPTRRWGASSRRGGR